MTLNTNKMKKTIKTHIEKQHYVKVYIEEKDGSALNNFGGIIFEQNDAFILMCDTQDFDYDGMIVLNKKDIAKIRRAKPDKFIDKVLEKENLKKVMIQNYQTSNFHLSTWHEMFKTLQELGEPVIVEMLYGNDELFHIGPINEVKPKSVVIDYIGADGKYELKPIVAKFKDITFIRIDSRYLDFYYKYAKRKK